MDVQFIETTGKKLLEVVQDDPTQLESLKGAGVQDETVVRVNKQGDIEVRRKEQWDIIGGLIGDFEERLQSHTGIDWA